LNIAVVPEYSSYYKEQRIFRWIVEMKCDQFKSDCLQFGVLEIGMGFMRR
jgi:hypothetical protein